jgi:hypothetical protein
MARLEEGRTRVRPSHLAQIVSGIFRRTRRLSRDRTRTLETNRAAISSRKTQAYFEVRSRGTDAFVVQRRPVEFLNLNGPMFRPARPIQVVQRR